MNGPNGNPDLSFKMYREPTSSAASTVSFVSIAGLSDSAGFEGVETANGRCICFRPLMRVFCKVCAYNSEGRVAKKCAAHPMTQYLLDINACPDCKGKWWLLEERPFAPGYVPTVENIKIR